MCLGVAELLFEAVKYQRADNTRPEGRQHTCHLDPSNFSFQRQQRDQMGLQHPHVLDLLRALGPLLAGLSLPFSCLDVNLGQFHSI